MRRLAPIPTPKQLDTAREGLTPEDAKRLKRSDCILYEDCLDVAVREDWDQFHCLECMAYVPEEQDASMMPGKGEWP